MLDDEVLIVPRDLLARNGSIRRTRARASAGVASIAANTHRKGTEMTRKFAAAVSATVMLCLIAGAASAAAPPLRLSLSEYGAFAVLGHWCGGISQKVYGTGFAGTGYPTGAEFLSTTCGGSGKGGGGGHTTYTAWASSEWNWYGETRKYAKLSGAPEGISETFSAEDSHGDHLYNAGTATYLEDPTPPLQAPAAPTNVTAYVQEI